MFFNKWCTLEDELLPQCLDDVADYFRPAEEEVEFQYLQQEINPETPPAELKQLPPGLQYVFLNDDWETPVIISDKLSHQETQKLVATLEKYRSVIGYSLKDLKGISPSRAPIAFLWIRTISLSGNISEGWTMRWGR
jgi:hypothetical protein